MSCIFFEIYLWMFPLNVFHIKGINLFQELLENLLMTTTTSWHQDPGVFASSIFCFHIYFLFLCSWAGVCNQSAESSHFQRN